MFPLTARFSFSALALRRCFGATYRSFRSTIPSRPLKRPSLSNATSMQTRFSSNKPMHILRRMMGLSAVAVVLKDAESSVATDATTCADVSQTNTVAEVEETMTSKTEVVSEVKPTPAVFGGKILQYIPGFDDEDESDSRPTSALTRTRRLPLTDPPFHFRPLSPPPLHHYGVTRSETVVEPADTPGLCPIHCSSPCGPCDNKDSNEPMRFPF